jgi:hypothetical protein
MSRTTSRIVLPGIFILAAGLAFLLWQKHSAAATRVVNAQGYEVTLDISHQILQIAVTQSEEKPGSIALAPSLAGMDLSESDFAPAAVLALKAKQFDDGLYAAVEVAADAGLNHFPDRKTFLLGMLKALAHDSNQHAQAILAAAAELGGVKPPVDPAVAAEAAQVEQEFLADELRSKVIGFYTWNDELRRVFQRDRLLQTPLEGKTPATYAAVMAHHADLFKAYTANLELAERLTNPFAHGDLRAAVAALQQGRTPATWGSLFPPSRAAETDLVKKLFGGKNIPEGFNLADEMIKRLRAGTLSLRPTADSGWYDYESYALEPLAVPEKMPEARRLDLDESYRQELASLFKAGMALTRETHIKQLETPHIVTAMPGRSEFRRPEIDISPGLMAEPAATYYLRRARSYGFVRKVLQNSFGSSGLQQMRRLTAAGPVNMPLDAELNMIEGLFYEAYGRVCGDLGMVPERDAKANAGQPFLAPWLAALGQDPDLGQDIRAMVPLFYDEGRQMTKVWVVLGAYPQRLVVSYTQEPRLLGIKDAGGKVVSAGDVDVMFTREGHPLAHIATAEVYVKNILNRTEFRRLCDQKKTADAILASLR